MTDIKTPAHYYAFEVCPEGEGAGRLLQHGPDLSALSPSRCVEMIPQRKGYGVEVLTLPPADTTTRTPNTLGHIARVTFTPWRDTLGTGERVKNCKPWAVFVNGSAVNAFERQSLSVAYCRGRGFPVPLLVKDDGTPWE